MSNISQCLQVYVLTVQGVFVIIVFAKYVSFLEFSSHQLELYCLAFSQRFFNFSSQPEGVVFLRLFELLPVGNFVLNHNLKRHVV